MLQIQVTLLVLAVDLPLNILCPLKELKLKLSMLENMTLYPSDKVFFLPHKFDQVMYYFKEAFPSTTKAIL